MRIAVCSGSFDPITLGHMDIIRRAAACFDQGGRASAPTRGKKDRMFTPAQKLKLVEVAAPEPPNVTVSCTTACCPICGDEPPSSSVHPYGRGILTRNISRPWVNRGRIRRRPLLAADPAYVHLSPRWRGDDPLPPAVEKYRQRQSCPDPGTDHREMIGAA